MLTTRTRVGPRTSNLPFQEVRRWLFKLKPDGGEPLDTGPYDLIADFNTGLVFVVNSFRCVVGQMAYLNE
jgi:hypothetical protein